MRIEVEEVSRETIKPSSPTPNHLRHHRLSYLDQIGSPVFSFLLYFFPMDSDTTHTNMVLDKSSHLKKSLSEALTRYYFLAGRVIDNLYVDCSDAGVPYVDARATCRLSEVVRDPIPGEFHKLMPCELDDIRDLPMVIQVTLFSCGGIVISIGISHKLADGLSMLIFINTWAAIARGDRDVPYCPRFDSAVLFPPRNLSGIVIPSSNNVKEKIVGKRFVFAANKIAALRDKYSSSNNNTSKQNLKRATRVEALSAFIWGRFIACTRAENGDKTHIVLLPMNLRTKTDPPLPEDYFGNISYHTVPIVPSIDNTEDECYGIVNLMRDSIRKTDGDYVKQLQEGNKHLEFVNRFRREDVVSFTFSSLCRFPLYESDFGWGKPVLVGSPTSVFNNLVFFWDSRFGDGIEAWVNLKEDDMAKFEADQELLEMVSTTLDHKSFRNSAL